MTRQFFAPDDEEILWIAQQWIAASTFAEERGAKELTGDLDDLASIQVAVDALVPGPESIDLAYALGLAFGRTFLENTSGYDWWLIEDDYGRDVCLRLGETSVAAFPGVIFANRFEDHEPIDVQALYRGLSDALDEVHAASRGGA